MPISFRGGSGRRRSARTTRPWLEPLEARIVLSGVLAPVAEAEANNTLDQAQLLGELTTSAGVNVVRLNGSDSLAEIHGTIGNGTAGAADVDWYRFTLTQATSVALTGTPLAGQAGPVL